MSEISRRDALKRLAAAGAAVPPPGRRAVRRRARGTKIGVKTCHRCDAGGPVRRGPGAH
ncbi:twin-arginine translocation signal domain-containing protein [Nonomuraea sp. NPDC049784]|uniref:twin-arginine translocation signal domain-containing protein n=1 Tax=Nonomuraea sp. NPDC049784 TaxID=3154361 RepID=UPI0033E37E13